MKKEYKKLINNIGLIAIGSFASSLLGMLLIPFYTAVLSTADYGISDLISTTTSLLYPIATMVISEAIMRFALDKDVNKQEVYSIGISVALTGFLIILLFSPVIKWSPIGAYYGYFLLYYLSTCLYSITSSFVKGLEDVKTYSFAGLMNSVMVIVCNLFFLLGLKIGIVGYLLSSIIRHISAILFMFLRAGLHRYIIPFWTIDWQIMRQMLKYSIPMIPNGISWWIANSSDKYILNHYADVSQVGIYAVSYKIPTIMITVMGFFITAWQISAVEDFGSERSQQFFSDIYKKCFALNALIAATLIAFSKVFAGFLYSADFFAAWRYVPVLIIANVCNGMSSFLGTIYTASKKTKMLSVSTMIGAVSNIVMNFVLIPSMGAMGAAIATALSYAIIWFIRIVNTRRIMRLQLDMKKDGLLVFLLVAEMISVTMDTTLSRIVVFMLYLMIILINGKMLFELFSMIRMMILSKLKR